MVEKREVKKKKKIFFEKACQNKKPDYFCNPDREKGKTKNEADSGLRVR
jgi:hypothetical protein